MTHVKIVAQCLEHNNPSAISDSSYTYGAIHGSFLSSIPDQLVPQK